MVCLTRIREHLLGKQRRMQKPMMVYLIISTSLFHFTWNMIGVIKVKVQSHYNVCIGYANLRKRMQISEKLLIRTTFNTASRLQDYRPLQAYK